MTRRLTITAAEWASVQPDGTLWLVRQGGQPPAELVQACVPCVTCGDNRRTFHANDEHDWCLDCRIELVGPCPDCDADGCYQKRFPDGGRATWPCDHRNTVTLGHAYANGPPETLVGRWALQLQVTP